MPVGMIDDTAEDLLDELGLDTASPRQSYSAQPQVDPLQEPLNLGGASAASRAATSRAAAASNQLQQPTKSAPWRKLFCAVFLAVSVGVCVLLFTRLYDQKQERMRDRGQCVNTTCPLIFVTGGCTACSDSSAGEQWQPTQSVVETYDPSTALWNTSLPPLPVGRSMLGLGVLQDVLYAMGGIQGGNSTKPCRNFGVDCVSPGVPSDRIDVFDPVLGKWSVLPGKGGKPVTMPVPLWGMATASFSTSLYVVGGFTHKPGSIQQPQDPGGAYINTEGDSFAAFGVPSALSCVPRCQPALRSRFC